MLSTVLVSCVATVFHVLIPAATAQTPTSKYRLVPQKMTYEAARSHCRSEYGTDLASIHNTADNDEAKNLCATGGDSCWFGLTDLAQENVFVWEDGTAFDYGTDVSGGVYPWHNSQPDDGQRDAPFASEECCELRVGFEYNWNDDQCSATKYFICNLDAIPATSNPLLNPTSTPTDSTSMPTSDPTNGPAKGPTNNLSDAASERQVEHSTTPVSMADEATGSSASPIWRNMPWAWAWVGIALCVLCCACSAYGFYYYRKKKDMSERDRQEVAREMPSAAAVVDVELAQAPPRPHDPVDGQWNKRVRPEQEEHKYDAKDDPNLVMAMEVPGAERQPGEADGAELTLSYEPQAEGQRNSTHMPREQSVTIANKRRTSDSSVMMHEDHYAARKVTNYYGIDDAQKLDMFDIEDPEQNGADTKGNKGNNHQNQDGQQPHEPIPHHYPSPKDDTAADYCEYLK